MTMALTTPIDITDLFNVNAEKFNTFPGEVVTATENGIYSFHIQVKALTSTADDGTVMAWSVVLNHFDSDNSLLESFSSQSAPWVKATLTADDNCYVSISLNSSFNMSIGDSVSYQIFDVNPFDAGGGEYITFFRSNGNSNTFFECFKVN